MAAQRLEPAQLERVKRIRALAKFLDESIQIPGSNYRVGFDGIIGLIPVVGDLVTAGLALYIVREATALGVSRKLLLKMLFNVGVDLLGGTVPIAGDALDFVWKANRKNIRLLNAHLKDQGHFDETDPVIDV